MYGGFVGGFGGGEVNSGFVFVTMKDPAERPVDPKTGKRLSQQDLMNVARQVTSAYPRRADRDAGLLAARLQPRPRRRLPRGVQHPRPRLGRARARLARDHGEDARVGPGDRRQQRLPGRHARGAGRPRPQQGGRPRDLDGRDRRHDQLRDRRPAHRASSRTRAGGSTSGCGSSRRSGSGRRTSSGCSCAPAAAGSCAWATSSASSSGPPSRRSPAATASARSPSPPTWSPASRRASPSTARCRSRGETCPTATAWWPPAPPGRSASPSSRSSSR